MKNLIILLYFFTSNLHANENITDLIKLGLENSFKVRSQKLIFEKNKNDLRTSYTNLLPSFSFSRSRTYSNSESFNDGKKVNSNNQSDSMSITANWTIWDNYSNIRNIQLSELSYDNTKLANKITIQEYILNLLEGYFSYQILLNDKLIQEANVEQSQWNYDEAKTQNKSGQKTQMDLVDSEIQLLNAQRSLVELNNQIILANRKLNFLLNTKSKVNFEKIDILEYRPYFEKTFQDRFESILTEWENKFEKNNLNLLQAQNSIETSLTSLKQTKLNYWPQVNISATHDFDMSRAVNPSTTSNESGNLNSSSISISLSWQFWDWWATPRSIDNAKKDFEINRISYKQTHFQIKNEIQNIIDQYKMIKQSIKISKLTLEKASKQVEYSREMYRLGRMTLLRRQTAISNFISARNTLASRLVTEMLLQAKLLAAMGETLIPEGIKLKWMNL